MSALSQRTGLVGIGALVFLGLTAQARTPDPLECHAYEYTDASKTELTLIRSSVPGLRPGIAFEFTDPARGFDASADYTLGESWVRLSIQVMNSGSVADVAFRPWVDAQGPVPGVQSAELIFNEFLPKTMFRIVCQKH